MRKIVNMIKPKSFSEHDIEKFRAALKALGDQAPARGLSARRAVEAIAPDIRALIKAGHRLEDIFDALKAAGFRASPATLQEYLYRTPAKGQKGRRARAGANTRQTASNNRSQITLTRGGGETTGKRFGPSITAADV